MPTNGTSVEEETKAQAAAERAELAQAIQSLSSPERKDLLAQAVEALPAKDRTELVQQVKKSGQSLSNKSKPSLNPRPACATGSGRSSSGRLPSSWLEHS
jgi:hypothetical protein